MFGYVRVQREELRVREWETYRGLYCSLCRALSRRYGLPARLILSYDMTFLLAVRLAQSQTVPVFHPGRCPFNPAKRCNYCRNGEAAFDFVSAAAVLMFYYKIKDNIADCQLWKKPLFYLLLPLAAWWRKKANRQFRQLDDIIAAAMTAQKAVEESGTDSVDRAAHASADALGKLICIDLEDSAHALYRLGYCVGRWVYLIDAADDLKKDLRYHNYNVFVRKLSLTEPTFTPEVKSEIAAALEMSQANAVLALEQTGLRVLYPILENIVLLGLHQQTERILKGDGNDERSL